MPEEPTPPPAPPPPAPRPVIPLDAPGPDAVAAGGDAASAVPPAAPPPRYAVAPVPVIPISEPGVVPPSMQASSPDPFNGLDDNNRAVVIQALRSRMRRPLNEARRQQLDTFLSEHGAQILNDPANALTTQKVVQHLGQVGQEFGSPGKP